MTFRDPAYLEATVKRLMNRYAALADPGPEYARQREKIHYRLDALLDEIDLEGMLAAS